MLGARTASLALDMIAGSERNAVCKKGVKRKNVCTFVNFLQKREHFTVFPTSVPAGHQIWESTRCVSQLHAHMHAQCNFKFEFEIRDRDILSIDFISRDRDHDHYMYRSCMKLKYYKYVQGRRLGLGLFNYNLIYL